MRRILRLLVEAAAAAQEAEGDQSDESAESGAERGELAGSTAAAALRRRRLSVDDAMSASGDDEHGWLGALLGDGGDDDDDDDEDAEEDDDEDHENDEGDEEEEEGSDDEDSRPIATRLRSAAARRRAELLLFDHDVVSDEPSSLDSSPLASPAPAPAPVPASAAPAIGSNDLATELRAATTPTDRAGAAVLRRLRAREAFGSLTLAKKRSLTRQLLPNRLVRRLGPFHHQNFCGSFSKDGRTFVSACQDATIRFFDFERSFLLTKEVEARQMGWSIIDVDFSPDQQFLIYSTWSRYVQLVNVFKATGSDLHLALDFEPVSRSGSVCFFSIKFSSDSREILAGSSDHCLYVYDVASQRRILAIPAHEDDINTVAWADGANNVLLSGSDDTLCKVWDRRDLRRNQPVGVLEGHQDGITYIHPRNDGRYFISNSKDQSIKLWDLRHMSDSSRVDLGRRRGRTDYRFGPLRSTSLRNQRLENDVSLQTYTGHQVYDTLIRAKFSPLETTGQRFVYSGSHDGTVYVWDALTGAITHRLEGGHDHIVRDVAWHPTLPVLCSSSWDGSVGVWEYRGGRDGGEPVGPPRRRVRRW